GPTFPRFSLEGAAASVPEPTAILLFVVAAFGVYIAFQRKRNGQATLEK
ncbi:MAG: PEP-CTERM sorting domain-containing protein, partial [Planctomycetota bacterium]